MPLHGLTQVTIGVPNVAETAQYYEEFGLAPVAVTGHPAAETGPERSFSTVDGGPQLRLVTTVRRRVVELRVGGDDPDDLKRIAGSLARLGIAAERTATSVRTYDPGTKVTIVAEIADHIAQADTPAPPYNTPGHIVRANERAPGVLRETPVRPRKLGHVVLGSTDQAGLAAAVHPGTGLQSQ